MQAVEAQCHSLETSALDGAMWSTKHPSPFTLWERATVTHCIGGWMGQNRSQLSRKDKISCMCWESNHVTQLSSLQPSNYTDYAVA